MTTTQTPSHPALDDESGFATRSRPHMGLAVRDLEASIRFYETLLGVPPAKVKPGYAKFEVAEPPLNLALNEHPDPPPPHPVVHFGIQVKSTEEVVSHHGRIRAAGFGTTNEEGVTCCFAVQDKIWAVDPDGNRWEVFVVLDDGAEVHSAPEKREGRLPGEPGGGVVDASAPASQETGRCCG